jgi:hypothetical protein
MLCAGVDCDDQNACTTDTCNYLDGSCNYANVTDGTTCDFGGLPGVCAAGACEDAMLCAGVDCDDGNQCTVDTCNPSDGTCSNDTVANGTSCDFGGLPGVCTAGTCEDAMLCATVDCDDGNACTTDTCDPVDGGCNYTGVTDGTTCDFGGFPGACRAGLCDCPLIQCDGRITACGNCIDDDGDGLVDNDDPECLGPCDNYEGEELLSGVGGESGEQCKADCYFDFGNGAGNDDCHWHRSCDPLEPKVQCIYDENKLGGMDCPLPTQSDLCNQVCTPLTPNGCDCFGCCTFPELQGGYVYIGSEAGCTFATVTDPDRCQPCTPAASCLNTCERCEICLGKPTIPEDCFPGAGGSGGMGGGGTGGDGGSLRCPIGKQACGLPGDPACPVGAFCLTGCCTAIVVQ